MFVSQILNPCVGTCVEPARSGFALRNGINSGGRLGAAGVRWFNRAVNETVATLSHRIHLVSTSSPEMDFKVQTSMRFFLWMKSPIPYWPDHCHCNPPQNDSFLPNSPFCVFVIANSPSCVHLGSAYFDATSISQCAPMGRDWCAFFSLEKV